MHTKRNNIKKGTWVDIVLKEDQGTNKLTRGRVSRILTNKSVHPRGIKVMLMDEQVGRVQHLLTKEEIQEENQRFYESFFSLSSIYTLFNVQSQTFLVFQHTNLKTEKNERTALLFDNKKAFEDFLVGTIYEKGDFIIKEIPKDESIVNKFIPLFVEYFRINSDRKISLDKFMELERRYRTVGDDDLI